MNRSRSSAGGATTRHQRQAFTMVELMLVIVLVSIIATVVVPGVLDSSQSNLPAAARMLAADLSYAQSLALSQSASYKVFFDTGADEYRVYRVESDGTEVLIQHPWQRQGRFGGMYQIRFDSSSPYGDVSLSVANFEGRNAVEFGTLGEPDHPGAVELTQGSQRIWVLVRPASGVVKVTRDIADVANLGI